MIAPGARVAVTRCRRVDDYLASLRRVGADPVVVEGGRDTVTEVFSRADGVVLTGGGDVDPRLYGEPAGAHTEPAEPGRDAFEIDLVVRAIERDTPLFAICRGQQVLNVACGGTLVQHIPDAVPLALQHQVASPADALAHEIDVAEDSRLAEILFADGRPAAGRVQVNSRHHQAVKRLAPGLVAVASAADGVIEAVERPASRFVLGVQWHPENFWRQGTFDGLFEAFLAACREPGRPRP